MPSDADSDDDRVAISDGGENETLEELPEPADPISFDLTRSGVHRPGRSVIARDFCESGCGHEKYPEMLPRRIRHRSPREHSRNFGWQGIWKQSAGSVRVEVVFLAARLLLFRPLR